MIEILGRRMKFGKRTSSTRQYHKGNQLASQIERDLAKEHSWMAREKDTIWDQWEALKDDTNAQLQLIEKHRGLEQKGLNLYKGYLKGKSDLKENPTTNKAMPKNVEDFLNIQDPVVRALVGEDLQLILNPLPQEVRDIASLHNELSLWNEHIERQEAEQIAYLGLTDLVDLDLSVMASVNHETQNTKVSLIRRSLKRMADKEALLRNNFSGNSSMVGEDRALLNLAENLSSHYGKESNRGFAIRSRISALGTQRRRKTLKRSGYLLALSKLPAPVLFVLGVVGLATGFPPLQIAGGVLLAISVGLKVPSILVQFGIGKKGLPQVDYSAELSGDYNSKEVKSLERSLGIDLGNIRGSDSELELFGHNCTGSICEAVHRKTEKGKKNKKPTQGVENLPVTGTDGLPEGVKQGNEKPEVMEGSLVGTNFSALSFMGCGVIDNSSGGNPIPIAPSATAADNSLSPQRKKILVGQKKEIMSSQKLQRDVIAIPEKSLSGEDSHQEKKEKLKTAANADQSAFNKRLTELRSHLKGQRKSNKSDDIVEMIGFLKKSIYKNMSSTDFYSELQSKKCNLNEKQKDYLIRNLKLPNLAFLASPKDSNPTLVRPNGESVQKNKKKRSRKKKANLP